MVYGHILEHTKEYNLTQKKKKIYSSPSSTFIFLLGLITRLGKYPGALMYLLEVTEK